MQNILVTGGAGFIGSNLVKELLKDKENRVFVFDNLSTGKLKNLPINHSSLKFYNVELLTDFHDWPVIKNLNYIYHLSANADVRGGVVNRDIDLKQNIIVTKYICDYARANSCKHLVFASSATVYGEPEIFPTPKNYSLSKLQFMVLASLLEKLTYKLIQNIQISKVLFLDLSLGLVMAIHME